MEGAGDGYNNITKPFLADNGAIKDGVYEDQQYIDDEHQASLATHDDNPSIVTPIQEDTQAILDETDEAFKNKVAGYGDTIEDESALFKTEADAERADFQTTFTKVNLKNQGDKTVALKGLETSENKRLGKLYIDYAKTWAKHYEARMKEYLVDQAKLQPKWDVLIKKEEKLVGDAEL